jgi:chromate transporter
MFSTFVGFMGAGVGGAVLMTIGMFLPAFSFTLIGHNVFERIIHIHSISNFLDGVTAAVMGLIAITAVELLRASAAQPLSAVVCLLALAALYAFPHGATPPVVVAAAAIAGQVLFIAQ